MRSRTWKIIVGLVLGLAVVAALAVALLYVFKPRLLWRTYANVMPAVFVDRLSGIPYSKTDYDGIDVSKHNGVIKWKQVAENKNIKFVYVKATEGSGIADRRYRKNVDGAKAQGLLIGSYHFLTSKTSIRSQFDNFRHTAVEAEQDLIPVLDIEEAGIKGKWTAKQLQDSVALFASLVKRHYGKLPVIYSNEHFYEHNLSPAFDNHYLFIANYRHRPDLGNAKHSLWQYSERGHVKGIGEYVDLIKMENEIQQLKLH